MVCAPMGIPKSRDINMVIGNTIVLALGLGENALLSMHNSNAFYISNFK